MHVEETGSLGRRCARPDFFTVANFPPGASYGSGAGELDLQV